MSLSHTLGWSGCVTWCYMVVPPGDRRGQALLWWRGHSSGLHCVHFQCWSSTRQFLQCPQQVSSGCHPRYLEWARVGCVWLHHIHDDHHLDSLAGLIMRLTNLLCWPKFIYVVVSFLEHFALAVMRLSASTPFEGHCLFGYLLYPARFCYDVGLDILLHYLESL